MTRHTQVESNYGYGVEKGRTNSMVNGSKDSVDTSSEPHEFQSKNLAPSLSREFKTRNPKKSFGGRQRE